LQLWRLDLSWLLRWSDVVPSISGLFKWQFEPEVIIWCLRFSLSYRGGAFGRAGPVSRCPLLLDCRLLSIEESLAIKGNGCCRLSVDRVPRRFAYPLHGQPTRFAPRLAVSSGNLLQPAMTLHVSATRSSAEINGTKNVKFPPIRSIFRVASANSTNKGHRDNLQPTLVAPEEVPKPATAK
jgi:hypothetical protein